jgi:hypothetical protein
MKSLKTALSYGFLIWVIPFLAAMFIFTLRETNRPLFESIMPVILAVSAVFFAVKYFQKIEENFLREGIIIGAFWMLASFALDFPMFSAGPMKMSAYEYISDIGLTYLMIPIITIGFGYVLEKKSKAAGRIANDAIRESGNRPKGNWIW